MMATQRDKRRIQVATLLTLMESETMDVYHSFDWRNEAEKHDLKQVKVKFTEYFSSSGMHFVRLDAFYIELKNVISSCKYHETISYETKS